MRIKSTSGVPYHDLFFLFFWSPYAFPLYHGSTARLIGKHALIQRIGEVADGDGARNITNFMAHQQPMLEQTRRCQISTIPLLKKSAACIALHLQNGVRQFPNWCSRIHKTLLQISLSALASLDLPLVLPANSNSTTMLKGRLHLTVCLPMSERPLPENSSSPTLPIDNQIFYPKPETV